MTKTQEGLTLNYVTMDGDRIKVPLSNMDAVGYDIWLEHMVDSNPKIIFFYTVDTTDIWEKEWDFNEVALILLKDMDPEFPWEISLDKEPNAFGYSIEIDPANDKEAP